MFLQILSCKKSKPEIIRSLDWIKNANAKDQFEQDIKLKKYRFYATYGYSLNITDIHMVDYWICFQDYIKIEPIEGTSDVIQSEEHHQLINIAIDFASEYNKLMRDYAINHGMTKCKTSENWGKAFSELNDYIWGKSQMEGALKLPTNQSDLTLRIDLKDKNRKNDTIAQACKVFLKNGIKRNINLIVYEQMKVNNKWENRLLGKYIYNNGKIVNLHD